LLSATLLAKNSKKLAMVNSTNTFRELPAQKTPSIHGVEQALRYAQIELGDAHNNLANRPQFQRTCEIYCRIAAATVKQDSGVVVSLDTFERVSKVFIAYCQAWALYCNGESRKEVKNLVTVTGVRDWLRRDSIPLALVKADPQYRLNRIERANIPEGISAPFAYVLGCFAANHNKAAQRNRLTAHHSDRGPLEKLCEACETSCGLSLSIKPYRSRDEIAQYVLFKSTLVPYFLEGSNQNTKLLWQHLTTSAERQEFLRGFFAFARVSISGARGVLAVTRSQSSILEQTAIVLKREGILPALVYSAGRTILSIESARDLHSMVDLGILPAEQRSKIIEPGSRQPSVESYFRALTLLQSRREQTLPQLVATCKAELGLELPSSTVRGWVEGRTPQNVERYTALEELQKKYHNADELSEIGGRIRARAAAEQFHPVTVVRMIVEYYGGVLATSRQTGLQETDIEATAKARALPSRRDYSALLNSVGLEFSSEFESGATPPSAAAVRSSLKKTTDIGTFDTYQASIVTAARDAYLRQDDPNTAVKAKIKELQTRSQRMLK
jgi:hypothetical protein